MWFPMLKIILLHVYALTVSGPQKARAGNLKLKVITLAPSLSNALIFFFSNCLNTHYQQQRTKQKKILI